MLEQATTHAPPERSRTSAVSRRRERARREILDAAWDLCREHGLAGLSLRELAARVGMRAPSLYSYFASKDAIYDAMFAEGQIELREHLSFVPEEGVTRADVHAAVRAFFEFCTADPVRHQLMFQRTLPGFEPSPESYALAVEQIEQLSRSLRSIGITDPKHLDLWTAVITGLVDQQLANDPGGDRWERLLDEAVALLCDHCGATPTEPTRRKS